MAFCHIYARRDGTFTVRMHGTISRRPPGSRLVAVDKDPFLWGTVEYTSIPVASEQEARAWIQQGRDRDGLDDMPEPKVIRR